jgi:hypothetical protein
MSDDYESPLVQRRKRELLAVLTENQRKHDFLSGKSPEPSASFLPYDIRPEHVFILGNQGTGKSTLMLNMIRQDIEAGKGVVLIETGNLCEEVLKYIPAARQKDVLYSPFDNPLPIDVFRVATDEERDALASDISSAFWRIFGGEGGEGMKAILRYAVLALSEYPDATFLHVSDFLNNPKEFIHHVKNPVVRKFWVDIFPGNNTYKPSVSALHSRMSELVTDSTLQRLFGVKHDAIDFRDVIQNQKILLASVKRNTKGKVMGSMILSKIQQVGMSRKPYEGPPIYVYCDEFQNYVTDTFIELFTEARKYLVCMTLATQLLQNVPDDVAANVLGAYTQIYFNSREGSRVKHEIRPYEPEQLSTLPNYHAFIHKRGQTPRLMRTELPSAPISPSFRPARHAPPPVRQPPPSQPDEFDDEIRPSSGADD